MGGMPCSRQTTLTLDEDAQVGAREGGVGVLADVDVPLRVQQEHGRLGEGAVGLAHIPGLADEEAPSAGQARGPGFSSADQGVQWAVGRVAS